MTPFAIPTVSDFAPLRPFAERLDDLRDILRRIPDLTPFAVLNAVYSCKLSVFEIGSTELDGIVDEARAQQEVANV
jgi:hypothetical protein